MTILVGETQVGDALRPDMNLMILTMLIFMMMILLLLMLLMKTTTKTGSPQDRWRG